MDGAMHFGHRQGRFDLWAYAGWVAASAAAALFGLGSIFLVIFAAKAVIPGVNEDRLMGGVMFLVLGAFIGAGQWLLLRNRAPRAGWWIVLTALGLELGVMLMFRLAITGEYPIAPARLALAAAGVGLCLGLAQLIVLRPGLRGALLWLTCSVLGWLGFFAVIGESMGGLSDVAALGAIPAAFTGLALMWLSPRRVID